VVSDDYGMMVQYTYMNWLLLLNYVVATGGLGLLAVTIFLYVDYYFLGSRYYTWLVKPFVWFLILATTIGSVILSLVYSEYFGFLPCSLCWLQRIALYPQALLGLMAYRLKEQVFFPLYGIALSAFGFIVAVYHYIYQLVPKEDALGNMILPCLADGSADCGLKVIDMYGFVTFPFLSAVTFAFLIVLYLNVRRG
jgi:disulfide bond formation protein DsbB